MKDINDWFGKDGPEAESMWPLLEVLRDDACDDAREPPPTTPEEEERRVRELFERLDAEQARREGA